MNAKEIERALASLSLLRYFPQRPDALEAVGEILVAECRRDHDKISDPNERLSYVVRWITSNQDEWLGPAKFRGWIRDALHPEEAWRAWNPADIPLSWV